MDMLDVLSEALPFVVLLNYCSFIFDYLMTLSVFVTAWCSNDRTTM